jgi:hypothetical protein
MFYTYIHQRADDSKVFYIGKGKDNRAWVTKRSKHWHSVVKKHGIIVSICAYWPTEEEALEHEVILISCFKKMKHPLVNQTSGGEGTAGMEPWNKGLTGIKCGVVKGQKRPGIGGVKSGNIPWNKGKSGYKIGKPSAKNSKPRSKLAIYNQILNRYGVQSANNWLFKSGFNHPDELRMSSNSIS